MQCFDFASRLQFVPLPPPLQRIVDSFLANDLIPLSLFYLSNPNSIVVGVIGNDVYHCVNPKVLMRNNEVLFDDFTLPEISVAYSTPLRSNK